MAIWPLYHFDDPVMCFKCGKALGLARDGEVVGFGDGNGNRHVRCGCGHFTFYDVTKSHEKVKEHAEANVEYFAAVRYFGTEDRKVVRGQVLVNGEPKSAFDLPVAIAKPPAPQPVASMPEFSAFDISALINQEVSALR